MSLVKNSDIDFVITYYLIYLGFNKIKQLTMFTHRFLHQFFLMFLLTLAVISCKKDDDDEVVTPTPTPEALTSFTWTTGTVSITVNGITRNPTIVSGNRLASGTFSFTAGGDSIATLQVIGVPNVDAASKSYEIPIASSNIIPGDGIFWLWDKPPAFINNTTILLTITELSAAKCIGTISDMTLDNGSSTLTYSSWSFTLTP